MTAYHTVHWASPQHGPFDEHAVYGEFMPEPREALLSEAYWAAT